MTKLNRLTAFALAPFSIFTLNKKGKTGEQLAEDFILAIEEDARDNRIVQLYRHLERGAYSYRGGWLWMPNPEWRALVSRLIVERNVPIRDFQFHPADAQGDWSFSAVSTVTTPRVATMELTQAL